MKFSLFISFLLLSQLLLARPNPIDTLKNKRKSLMKDIEFTTNLLSVNKATKDNTVHRLDLLNQQITNRKQVLETLNQEIAIINDGIVDKEAQILTLEKELREKKLNYITSVRKMYSYKNGSDKFMYIFSAKYLPQSYQRLLYLKKYSLWQKEKSNEITIRQNKIAQEKQSLEKDKLNKIDVVNERESEKMRLEEEEKNKKATLDTLTKNGKAIQAELTRKNAEVQALDKQIEKIIAEEIAASKKAAAAAQGNKDERKADTQGGYAMTKDEKKLSSSFAQNKGNLPFPLKGKYKIVESFGLRKDKELRGIERVNNGIDIGTTESNDATAVFDGVVSIIRTTTYNNSVVFVRHGNYITLYANLETIYVKEGNTVKTGQALGRIFTNKLQNVTLLHFEMRRDFEKLDPLIWLNK